MTYPASSSGKAARPRSKRTANAMATTTEQKQVEKVELTRLAAEQIAGRAALIYVESIKEADACDPEYIVDDGEEVWSLTLENRAKAISYYASEMGLRFQDVRCTRSYMRINRDAIRENAAALAFEYWENGEIDEPTIPIANTWEGEGWLYERCGKKAPGAIALWRCEAKPPTQQDKETS